MAKLRFKYWKIGTPLPVDPVPYSIYVVEDGPNFKLYPVNLSGQYLEAIISNLGVETVTGDGVDNSDTSNPILSFPNADQVDDSSTINKFVSQTIINTIDSALQSGDNISEMVNDLGYITSYSVTENDVTQHEDAITITESQISDLNHFQGSLINLTDVNSSTPTDKNFLIANGTDWSSRLATFYDIDNDGFFPVNYTPIGGLDLGGQLLGIDNELATIVNNNNWGTQSVVSDITLSGTGIVGNELTIVNPFPGFTDLLTDYTITLATVATSGDYNDLVNTPLDNYRVISTSQSVLTTDKTLDIDTPNIIITMMDLGSLTSNNEYNIANSSGGDITIDTTSSQEIYMPGGKVTSVILSDGESLTIKRTPVYWRSL